MRIKNAFEWSNNHLSFASYVGKVINDFIIFTQTLLGVSHFTFYNHSLGPKAACVLRHYMEEGLANANNATQDGTIQHGE